jgi:hypothetical protein
MMTTAGFEELHFTEVPFPKGQIPSTLSVFGAAVLLGRALWCECVGRTFQEREDALLFWMLYTMTVVQGDDLTSLRAKLPSDPSQRESATAPPAGPF